MESEKEQIAEKKCTLERYFYDGDVSRRETILRIELNNVMSQQVLPNMDLLIDRWIVMLTLKDTMVATIS